MKLELLVGEPLFMGTYAGVTFHTPWLHTTSCVPMMGSSYLVQENSHRHIRSQKEVSLYTVAHTHSPPFTHTAHICTHAHCTHWQTHIHENSTVNRRLKILYPKLSAAVVTFLWERACMSHMVRWEEGIPACHPAQGSCPAIPEGLG